MTMREYWAIHFSLIPEQERINTYTTDEPYLTDEERKRVNRMKERLSARNEKK